jgi:23S rRNA G2445 N2-methylase RlmL
VIDSFQDRGRLRPPVRLDDPEVSVYVEVHDGGFWVGLDTTGPRSLHQRDYRICDHPAPLRSTLAYGMVRLSGWSPEESFMDPMCGSGTICIEAGHWANRVPNWFRSDLAYARLPFLDQARLARMKREADGTVVAAGRSIHGCDVSAGHVLRAEENARHAGVPCHLFSGDALRVSLDCDRIVTNPPFGFRMGSRKRVEALYRAFMDRLDRHDWKSAVILTGRPDLLPVPAEATRVQVRIGNLPASIWVVKRDPAGSAVGP